MGCHRRFVYSNCSTLHLWQSALVSQRSSVGILLFALCGLLVGCDGAVSIAQKSDELSDVFIPELDEETGPVDDGLSPDEPVFHIAGDYELDSPEQSLAEPLIGAALPADPSRKQQGAWSRVFNWPVSPIHMTLLPDDSVLTYGTNPDAQNATAFTFDKWLRERGMGSDSHETTPTGIDTNLFCSAQTVLPDGNVLISGGDGNQVNDQTVKNDGIDATTLFDYQTNILFNGPAMHFPRWYPTLVTLSDGKQLVLGGRKFKNNSPAALTDNVSIPPVPEVYDPETGRWELLSGASDQSLFNRIWSYPRSWLRHDGTVVVADALKDKLFEVSVDGRGSLSELGLFPGSFGSNSSPAAMFEPGKILFVARNKVAEVLDISGNQITIERTTSNNVARQWADATILANGEVFLSGGIARGAATNSGNYPGEIWNPETGTWTVTANAAKARLYHSTAMLLPNGRVLTAGGGPPGPVVNMNAEVFIPPYLFDETGNLVQQPVISQIGDVDYGNRFNATVASNSPISKVSFIRSSSVTHSFDQGQRYMALDFEQTGNTLDITSPVSRNIAPPGLYMLFVIDDKGVPSQAKLVMLGGDNSFNSDPEPADTDTDNLISNGGFEADKTGWSDCSAANLSEISTQSSNGSNSLLQKAGACLYQEVPVTPGATYTLICDALVQDSAYSSISTNMLDTQYNELTSDTVGVTSAEYTSYSRSVQAPPTAVLSAVTLYAEGPTLFDSCIFKRNGGPTDPEVTPEPIPAPANNLLANSDFNQGKTSWTDCAATPLTSVVAAESNAENVLTVNNTGCIYQEFPVTAGNNYELQCMAKSEGLQQYSSITLQMSDQAYVELDSKVTEVGAGSFAQYRSTLTAPPRSSIGAVTLYSEDTSHFDACYVMEI